MPLDNKISNIIGTKLPKWVLNQLETRSNKNTQDSRDNDNILYLTNKSAWVRLVSSVDIGSEDLLYFKNQVGANLNVAGFGVESPQLNPILNPTSLAKEYVLFGGTSKYLNKNSYGLRSGIDSDGSYGMLGRSEVQQFGYKPMPGITNVTIDTQGRLGSVRSATINFKCWDKSQLDIIDALYFKLGFTMFLEWGHTYFYYSGENNQKRDPNKIVSTELYSIDPFEKGLNKEDIQIKIAQNSRDTEGNYDAMLGIVTNFNFTYTQDGGYDCSVRLMALGVLGDSIKINNSGTLPSLLKEEIIQLNNTLVEISNSIKTQQEKDAAEAAARAEAERRASQVSILAYLNSKINTRDDQGRLLIYGEPNNTQKVKIVEQSGIINSTYNRTESIDKFDFLYKSSEGSGLSLYSTNFGAQIPEDNIEKLISEISLDKQAINSKLESFYPTSSLENPNLSGLPTIQEKINVPRTLSDRIASNSEQGRNALGFNSDYRYSFSLKYKGKNGRLYIIKIDATLPEVKLLYTDQIQPIVKEQGLLSADRVNKSRPELYKEVVDFILNTDQKFDFNNIQLIAGSIKDVIRESKIPYSLISDNEVSFINSTANGQTFSLVFKGQYYFDVTRAVKISEGTLSTNIEKSTEPVQYSITITDTSLISNILLGDESPDYIKNQRNLTDQNVKETTTQEDEQDKKEALDTQIKQALNYQSTLEIMLRTIQLHALNKAINKNKDLEIGRETYILDITDPNDKIGNKTFLNQIFSTGVFSSFINDLVNNKVSNSGYTTKQKMVTKERFQIYSKYGFATSLLGNKAEINEVPVVDFKKLLKAYVVPYQVNQEIIKGTYTNHPVYIPLGLVLMILNHSCTIYDSTNNDFQTPLVYIDFNPETNFCLTNAKQLSTDPWTCLIPFQGGFEDYKALFDKDILNGDFIQPTSDSTEKIPLFNPEKQDFLSGNLPQIKFDSIIPPSKYISSGLGELIASYSGNIYRGKVMNILLSIDYLVQLAQQYSYKDGTNSVYLKTFIEQILNDVNKSLGNFNSFRLSYNDSANTFQIVDDQLVPSLSNEEQVSPKSNTTELPLAGKFSIAKNLEIKSEVSSRLSNMLAISANANSQNKATLSTNGDSFGFVNTDYRDRYISNRGEISGSAADRNNNDTLKISAAQFNTAISDFYSKINPSQASVSHATNYYIEKMTLVKNNEYATRASAMIPVSINFTIDGISGMSMGQAFTVPDILLPYTYTSRKIPGAPSDYLKNVGFAVVGLTHTIDGNQWNTAVKANMIYLKDKTAFTGSVVKVNTRTGIFGVNIQNDFDSIPDSNYGSRDYSNYPVIDSSQYKNIKFGRGNLGNPEKDKINPQLLNDINSAAQTSGVIVTITTAISGHDSLTSTGQKSRHTTGNAVDIAIVNGVSVSNKNQIGDKVKQFTNALNRLGYAINVERGNKKAILTYGFPNHEDHIHISNMS